MKNVTHINHKAITQQQACDWVSKIDRGLSEEEKQKLSRWCSEDEGHRAALFKIASLWDDLSSLNELKGLFPLKSRQTHMPTKKNRLVWGVAASLTFLVGILLMTTYQPAMDEQNFVVKTSSAATTVGEQKPVTLEDGSVIHLNTDSLVKITYSQRQRNISLVRGEAHFVVAHDPQRPFIVKAGKNTVTAVGTAFNIQLENDGSLELLVTEGKVLVRDRGTAAEVTTPTLQTFASEGVLMRAGERATVMGNITSSETIPLDEVQRSLAWQQGMLVFQGESLVDALKEVSRYSSVEFDVKDESINQTRVAGYFKAGDIKGLLFALKNNFNIDYYRQDSNTVVLTAGQKT